MVAWIALVLSALTFAYSVWNEVTKRRLQYEASFVHAIGESEYDAEFDKPKPLTLENVGQGNAHNVVFIWEFDPTGIGFGNFAWPKIAAGERLEQVPKTKLPDDLRLISVAHQLRDRTPWWRSQVTVATVSWTTPHGQRRKQRITASRRSMRW